MIQEQGSFAVGGTVITNPGTFDPHKPSPEGQTFHGDHAYVFYQVPANARKLPLVMWHGAGQFSKTWETTPDGREGFQNIFLRRGFPRLPHRPAAARPCRAQHGRGDSRRRRTSRLWFNIFRVGIWPNYFPGVQFSRDPEALNQYFRADDAQYRSIRHRGDLRRGVSAVRQDRPGHSGHPFAKRRSRLAYGDQEPERAGHRRLRAGQQLLFPEGEVPPPMPSATDAGRRRRAAGRVHAPHQDAHRHLLRRQHPRTADRESGEDNWRVRLPWRGCGAMP